MLRASRNRLVVLEVDTRMLPWHELWFAFAVKFLPTDRAEETFVKLSATSGCSALFSVSHIETDHFVPLCAIRNITCVSWSVPRRVRSYVKFMTNTGNSATFNCTLMNYHTDPKFARLPEENYDDHQSGKPLSH